MAASNHWAEKAVEAILAQLSIQDAMRLVESLRNIDGANASVAETLRRLAERLKLCDTPD